MQRRVGPQQKPGPREHAVALICLMRGTTTSRKQWTDSFHWQNSRMQTARMGAELERTRLG